MNQTIEMTPPQLMTEDAVSVDSHGIARIARTRIKVSQIALEYAKLGWTREQIINSHPHLSSAQVTAALAYFDTHREKIEAQISASLAHADQARQETEPSKLAAKLRAEARQVR